MKILLFGTGDYYQRYKIWLDSFEIVALMDNNIQKQGESIDENIILSPQNAIKQEYDLIYILSIHRNEMQKQLLSLGVLPECVRTYQDLQSDFIKSVRKKDIFFYGKEKMSLDSLIRIEKKVLLISAELQLNGAGIALLYAAKILQQNGYNIVVASIYDGTLRAEYMKIGIPVIIDVNLQFAYLSNIEWLKNFSFIFVNTIDFCHCLTNSDIGVPIIWWLHEPESLYFNIDCDELKKMNFDNITVCAVSEVAKNAFQQYCADVKIHILFYGIPDTSIKRSMITYPAYIVFAVVGTVSYIKGQDLFFEAIQKINPKKKDSCEFWIVGNTSSDFAKTLINKIKFLNLKNIKIIDELNRNEIKIVYNKITMLVCPSRVETMSIVSTEAMMNYKPCIVSDGAGISAFIEDTVNGFVCKAGDVSDLAKKMEWVIDHKDKIKKIGYQSRRIYDHNFSMKAFADNLMNIIRGSFVSKMGGPSE